MKSTITAIFLIIFGLQSQAQLFDPEHAYTRADTLRGSLRAERTCYDVLTYDLAVKVDIANKAIEGSNTINFKAVSDFQRLQIDLFEELSFTKIIFEGKDIQFKREFAAVWVDFPKVIKGGTQGEFTVYYSGHPRIAKMAPWDGGISWNTDEKGNPWVGVSCQGLGASVWWPNKDHLSDEPESMRIAITAPDTLMAVANGNLISTSIPEKGWKTWHWAVTYPINNYNVTMNIGKYVHFEDTYTNVDGSTYSLDYYVLEYNVDKAKKQFEQVKPMLKAYEQYLGAYPFPRDGYALVETPYVGMEHQSAIAYGNGYQTGYSGFDYSGIGLDFDYIIIHETAHEWWGNNVSMKDLADMWIHEGFGTYSEAIYVEALYGNATAMNYIDAMKQKVRNDEPIIGDYNVNNEGSGDMYHKGAIFLNSLRTLTNNDQLWWSIIKGIQKDFAQQTVTTEQIERYISRKAGKDFSKEFDQYLRHKDLPKFEYKLTPEAGAVKLEYRWSADVPEFDMPLRYMGADGAWKWLKPTTDWQETSLDLPNIKAFKLDTTHFYFEERMVKK